MQANTEESCTGRENNLNNGPRTEKNMAYQRN